MSGIGRPVSDPRVVDLRVWLPQCGDPASLLPRVREIVAWSLDHVSDIRDALLEERISVA